MEPITPPEIERQLQEIQSLADSTSPEIGIGSLTAEKRDTWHELRERLISLDRNNQRNLDLIETSLFALVLDENEPSTETEVCREAVVGDCRNRWFDKSVSILVFKSGRLATLCDHTPFDGVVEINSIILALKYLEERGGEWKGSPEIKNHFKPQELVFKVDDVICRAVEQAVQTYQQAAATVNVMVYAMREYDCIASLRPLTRQLRRGNFTMDGQKTVRSCTVEGTAWCKAMFDENTDNSTRLRLFREACTKHNRLMKEAVDGQGIDRHLLGLQLIAASEGMPTPAIFTDKAWTASGGGATFVLSTSCVGFSSILGGCAAMVKDGYGAFYSIEENKMNFVIATFTNSDVTDANKFQDALGESFKDMRSLLLTSKL
ncbi:hypothetical protein OS493_035818 [Desmophyllum pertusum]|uniref:Choline/carnitine acyltransferase domain-containing protein n=1 Tax=Desmophyllum pertusum TaxID=174260 RepID=A0A9W9Y7G6_9CNID|nr:hypothetical protein OS493_035818 [Desmophyllum pertusum]